MTPNFALSLSFEGIRLMRRLSDGWVVLGEVAPDDPELTNALAEIRDAAGAEQPLPAKLILPHDQIKFMTIDTAQTSEDDVRAALDGATPYDVSDLEIDFDRTGGRTYIAAVAKETLAEAKQFAKENGFDPLAFVAVPEPLTFRTEIMFGDRSRCERDGPDFHVIEEEPTAAAEVEEPVVFTAQDRDPPEDPLVDEEPENETEPVEPEPVEGTEDASEDVPLFGTRRTVSVTPPSAVPEIGPAVQPPHPKQASEDLPKTPAAEEVTTPTPPLPSEDRRSRRAKSSEEAREMTVYGARKKAQVGGKPKYLGLMLTGALILFLVLVGLWASTLSEDGVAGWFRSPDLVEDAPIETAAPVEPRIEEPEVAPILREETTVVVAPQEEAAPLPVPDPTDTPLPILREAVGRVLSPAEADRIYAATGVYQRAPRMPLLPRGGDLVGFQEAKAIFDEGRLDQIVMPERDPMLPDASIATPRNPPPPGVTYARDLRGFILATPEGTVTPDGAIVFSGPPEQVPPFRPGTEVPEIEVERPLTGGNAPLVLVAGPPPRVPPLRPEGLAPLPDVAAVVATPNAGLLVDQDDLVVLSGTPSQRPPPRPEGFGDLLVEGPSDDEQTPETTEDGVQLAETALLAVVVNPTNAFTPAGVNLASYRPNTRPATLAPSPDAAIEGDLIASADPTLAGFRPSVRPSTLDLPAPDLLTLADPTLAGFRPTVRPGGLAPSAAPQSDDIASVLAAITSAAPASPFVTPTSQAVPQSPRPDTRPRNFSQVVARAQTTAVQPASAPSQVTSAPAIASGPVPGGVARAATIDNAIRLRDVNLIGVYGRPSDRRALVRLSNGRYVRVEVGDSLDGGRVTAIGDSALNYVKRGRTIALELPSG